MCSRVVSNFLQTIVWGLQGENHPVAWGKEKAKLKHQITQTKRNSWNIFLSKLNYKTDGQKAFKFMNKLNNRYSQKQLQPLIIQDKEITDDKKLQTALTPTSPMFTN